MINKTSEEYVMLWIGFSENLSHSSSEFSQFLDRCIINLSRYGSQGCTSVVLGNSEDNILGEREDKAFYPFFYCVLVIYGMVILEQRSSNFLVFRTSSGIL